MLYDNNYREETKICGKNVYEGESIEMKVARILDNKEPIEESGSQLIYSNSRNEGVLPETDIRTDRFDVAVEAMDIASKARKAQREDKEAKKIAEEAKKGMKKEGIEPPQNE
jgi:hypothetical protein